MTHVKNSLLTLHRHQSCVPTKRGIKMLEISVWLYPRLSNFQPECSIAVIEEHTECECGCSVEREGCRFGYRPLCSASCGPTTAQVADASAGSVTPTKRSFRANCQMTAALTVPDSSSRSPRLLHGGQLYVPSPRMVRTLLQTRTKSRWRTSV